VSSESEICNLALGHLGIGKTISNFDTDTSQEAKVCRRFYTIARDEVLRDFEWPFATQIEALALISEDPNTEWSYMYRYPTTAVDLRRILSGIRNETRQNRIPYRVAFDSSAKVIFTDEQAATAEYTYKVTDPTFYPSDFIMAFSYRIATLIASTITAGDPFNLREQTGKLYEVHIKKAAANSMNEEQADEEVNSELQRARE
jgi:hypothetical protein